MPGASASSNKNRASGIGPGCFLIGIADKLCYFHDGRRGGFSSILLICPSTRQVPALLFNRSGPKGVQETSFAPAAALLR